MSRPIAPGENLDGAVLRARTGIRSWRAKRVETVTKRLGGTLYELTPMGPDVTTGGGSRLSGGVRRIFRDEDEIYLNGWRRVS